jgi:hypothetical protein
MIFWSNNPQVTFGGVSRRFCLLSTLCLSSLVPMIALAQNPLKRDQQALTIITQTLAAGGGQRPLASIHDFTETGTVTYYWADQVTGNVTVKGRGLHQLKIEADLPDGKRTTVVSGDGGSLTEPNGTVRPILRQSANDLGNLVLPYLPLIAAMQDPTSSIIYGGFVTHNGASAYDVRVQKVYARHEDPLGNRGAREAHDFYIDPKTFLVAAVSDRIYFGGRSDPGTSHEDRYSNYHLQNGIAVPLTIEQTVQGVTGFTLAFSEVTFNSGVADSEFAW